MTPFPRCRGGYSAGGYGVPIHSAFSPSPRCLYEKAVRKQPVPVPHGSDTCFLHGETAQNPDTLMILGQGLFANILYEPPAGP